MNKSNLTLCQKPPVSGDKYFTVLTRKFVGGFDLAVLTNLISSLASVDAVFWCFAFCTVERFYILSLIVSLSVYAKY